jgi:hypothetical protein
MKLQILSTEIRRRLWWLIRMIDIASAEDCGFLPAHVYGEDTQVPLHVNDKDLRLGMPEPPVERDEFTDMTFSLIRVRFLILS